MVTWLPWCYRNSSNKRWLPGYPGAIETQATSDGYLAILVLQKLKEQAMVTWLFWCYRNSRNKRWLPGNRQLGRGLCALRREVGLRDVRVGGLDHGPQPVVAQHVLHHAVSLVNHLRQPGNSLISQLHPAKGLHH